MSIAHKILGRVKFRFHERAREMISFRWVVGELDLPPSFDLPAHRLEVPLHAEILPRNISSKPVS